MAFMFTIATKQYTCPRCGSLAGVNCRTPKGRKIFTPHGERVSLLTQKEKDSCKIQSTKEFEL